MLTTLILRIYDLFRRFGYLLKRVPASLIGPKFLAALLFAAIVLAPLVLTSSLSLPSLSPGGGARPTLPSEPVSSPPSSTAWSAPADPSGASPAPSSGGITSWLPWSRGSRDVEPRHSSPQAGGLPMRRVVGEPSPTDLSRSRWTWSKAKTLAASAWEAQIPGEGSYTGFYCGCSITRKGASGGVIDTASCGYRTRSNASRAKRLEWEHVLPASRIGRGRACWVQGARQCVRNGKAFKGRECCEMADATYNMAATDPVNLVPSVGEVNGDRSDMPYGELGTRPPSGTYTYGQCQALVSPSLDLAEPPDDRKGDVARVMAYMSQAYGLPFTPEEAQLYSSWMRMDPVSGEEIQINLAIEALGHRPNPLVLGR